MRAWKSILTASLDAAKDDQGTGSFVVLVHGIGGMGKSTLLRHIVDEIKKGAQTRRRRAPMSILIDLEDERRRVPDRYPALEGPSVGTLLYAVERAVCACGWAGARGGTSARSWHAPWTTRTRRRRGCPCSPMSSATVRPPTF